MRTLGGIGDGERALCQSLQHGLGLRRLVGILGQFFQRLLQFLHEIGLGNIAGRKLGIRIVGLRILALGLGILRQKLREPRIGGRRGGGSVEPVGIEERRPRRGGCGGGIVFLLLDGLEGQSGGGEARGQVDGGDHCVRCFLDRAIRIIRTEPARRASIPPVVSSHKKTG